MGSRKTVYREIARLARSRANDAVKLAFLDGEALERLEELDLSVLTEFKRSGNGTVELKFVDRVAALEWLAERAEDPRAKQLYEALEKGALPDGGPAIRAEKDETAGPGGDG